MCKSHGVLGFCQICAREGKDYDREALDKDVKKDIINQPAHYTSGKIECWDYIVSQQLGYLEGNIIKYVTRYRHKNGREDLLKARAYLTRLLSEVK